MCLARFVFSPEKFIYGHSYPNKFLEFVFAVIVVPASAALFYLAKTNRKYVSAGFGILMLLSGFFGLLLSTFIEKGIVNYQLTKNGIITKGVIEETYYRRKRSGSTKLEYNFIVSFKVNNTDYNSLPGFTDEEIYSKGDSITVVYLNRDPFLNKIYYDKEVKSY